MIHVLDENIIKKIAAGEVIESPSSIVKELLENSIDANASKITIDIKKGGKETIKISDDGTGMDKEDLKKCILKHSTSKLNSEDDLFNIKSLGFRGEALSSIAAISKMQISSKKENSYGYKIFVEDSKILSFEKTARSKGTTIIVNDIFYNTPARKKFMKSDSIEFSKILTIVSKYILINKNIHIKLIHNGKIIINSPKTKNQIDNILSVYGLSIASKLIKVDFDANNIKIKGFISKPELSRSDKTYMNFYINRRYIKSRLFSDAILEGYHTRLNVGRYPIVILEIYVDPKKIDVNIHPSKLQIKIEQEKEVYNTILKSCEVLKEKILIPKQTIKDNFSTHKITFEKTRFNTVKNSNQTVLKATENNRENIQNTSNKDLRTDIEDTYKNIEDRLKLKENTDFRKYNDKEPQRSHNQEYEKQKSDRLPEMKIIGSIYNSYFLAEYNEGLLIIDQHAVHERINYEKLIEEHKNKKISVQSLIKPEIVDVSKTDKETIISNIEIFRNMGFDIEDFGNNTFIIRALPIIIGRQQTKDVILDIIDDINKKSQSDRTKQIEEKILITMSCRMSHKAHDELTIPQMKKIIEDLRKCKNPYTCPHGRPTIIKFTIKELEKRFKRI